MRRYLSIRRASSAQEPVAEKSDGPEAMDNGTTSSAKDEADHNASTTALLSPSAPLAPANLKVKRVDYYYSRWSKTWKYKNMGEKVTAENIPLGSSSGNDPWQSFCFVVVRSLPRNSEESEPTFHIIVKSPYLLQACKDVMQKIPGLSWNADPLQLNPQMLIAFLPLFEEYHRNLKQKRNRSQEETYVMSSVGTLIEYLHKDYRTTIASIARLTSHGEITFELLYAVLVPRSLLLTSCPITGEPRAVQLVSATKVVTETGRAFYDVLCESLDADDEEYVDSHAHSADAELRKAGAGRRFGRVSHRIIIPGFQGTLKINELDTYPIKYHVNEAELRKALIARGRKWAAYQGVHHVQYKGTAAFCTGGNGGCKRVVKYNVNSRIMVDRGNFRHLNPNYELPKIKREASDHSNSNWDPHHVNDPNRGVPTLSVQAKASMGTEENELKEEELVLASPVVYGFSLSDKIWLEFNIQKLSEIEWNDEAFANLVLPADRKTLLRSLVEAHKADLQFDDFVKGKGHGLVINLFGPPGVGKTLSAEATSEHVRSPLYVISGGDLGTTAGELDATLQRVFDIATSWKAIVLIDEADVFLEQRSLHDLERNAMVAVFLRHLEYYRGILFLTTNRVKTFDEAFLSRIHVALHFQELSHAAKTQVWRAFLHKVNVDVGAGASVTEEQLGLLAQREINGRQIKNATRTACSLAAGRGETLRFNHLVETLDAMDEFTTEFKAMTMH